MNVDLGPLEEITNISKWSDFIRHYDIPYYDSSQDLTVAESNQYVSDYFTICEKEGFSSKYWTPMSNSKYTGKPYKVLGRHYGMSFPMWLIEFENGAKLLAYPENVIPHEMQVCGCPYYSDYVTYA